MARIKIKLGKDWDRFMMLGKKARGDFNRGIGLGTRRALLYLQSEIINRINSGTEYEGLAESTLVMRDAEGYGSKPLIRSGGLIRAIAFTKTGMASGEVGLLFGKTKDGGDFANLGKLLHDGGTIRVTDKMRRAFMRKFAAIMRKQGRPMEKKAGSGFIRIPARPFIGDVFQDAAVVKKVADIYDKAIFQQTGWR